jgi:hypothetical protein
MARDSFIYDDDDIISSSLSLELNDYDTTMIDEVGQ